MINYKASAKLHNTTIDELKAWFSDHPGSEKRIVTICDDCGFEREVYFFNYRNLCPSCAAIKYHINNPEAGKENSKRQIERCSDPEVRKGMSKSCKKAWLEHPENWDGATEKKIGGTDICDHHIAYDFLRPKALTVKITRKYHGQIHNPKGCKFGTHGYSLID